MSSISVARAAHAARDGLPQPQRRHAMVVVILGREIAVTVFRSLAQSRGIAIPASPLGKFKMVSEVVAILALILGQDHLQQFYVIGTIALWIAMVTATVSGVDYYRRFARM